MLLNLYTNNFNELEIFQGDEKVIKIKTDGRTKAFRINCCDSKRVFFVEEGDAKSNLDVIINEYSQPLGFIQKLKNNKNSGFIEIENKKYIYVIDVRSSVEVMLYENAGRQPILTCSIDKLPGLGFANSIEIKYILFALTWFLLVNSDKKETMEFAELLNK